MSREVLVIETGTANTASVLAGLTRAGAAPQLASDAERIARADRVVLPGVGALAAAMGRLRRDGLDVVLRERIDAGRPTLAICLGLQLLCDSSEESPGVPGLGLVPGAVKRFTGAVTVPQMGWNAVRPDAGCRYLQPGFAYFANSFCLTTAPHNWHGAWADHGGPFIAALEKGEVLACQFHPELSAAWGAQLLRGWISGRPAGGGPC